MKFEDKHYTSILGHYHQELIRYGLSIFILYKIANKLFNNPTVVNVLLGLLLLATGTVLLVAKKGIEVDFAKNQFRYLYVVFSIKVSLGWRNLPNVEYISVLKNAKEAEITVSMVLNKNNKIVVAELKNKEHAFSAADYFAQNLGNIRILDATVRPFAWLNE